MDGLYVLRVVLTRSKLVRCAFSSVCFSFSVHIRSRREVQRESGPVSINTSGEPEKITRYLEKWST